MPSPRRTSRAVVVCAAIAMVASVACAAVAATSASNARVRGVVLFVGDSNISIATKAIDLGATNGSHLNNGYVPVFASRVGAGIRTPDCLIEVGCTTNDYWKVKEGAILQRVQPDVIVTDLGINDTAMAGTATTAGYAFYGAKIDWFMGLQPDVPVLWTNLPCTLEPAYRRTGCRAVNMELAAATARWPKLVVVNWGAVANVHPGYMTDRGQPYAVHYSDAGLTAWAALVVAALDARLVAV